MDRYRTLTVRPAAEAHILVGALRAEGFEVALERNSLGAVYGLTSGAFASHVLVARRDFAQARAFLAAIED